MPGRKTRANNGGGSGAKNGPVETRRVPAAPKPYTEDEARDLLFQGYGDEQVAFKTGFPLAWVRRQSVPKVGLKQKLIERRRPVGS